MTIVSLVVSLLITGIAKTADSARGDRVAMRSVVTFIALLWVSTAMAAVLVPALLGVFPMPTDAARSLAASLSVSASVDAPIGREVGRESGGHTYDSPGTPLQEKKKKKP